MVLAFVLAVAGTLLGAVTGGAGSWAVDGNQIFNGFVLSNLIGVLIGFALAMLIMNTAGAIVAYFVYSADPAHRGRHPRRAHRLRSRTSRPGSSSTPRSRRCSRATTRRPARSGRRSPTSGFIWLVVPLALGIWRLLRIEFK